MPGESVRGGGYMFNLAFAMQLLLSGMISIGLAHEQQWRALFFELASALFVAQAAWKWRAVSLPDIGPRGYYYGVRTVGTLALALNVAADFVLISLHR